MNEPVFYLGPLWVYNRAIIRSKSDQQEYVVCHYRVESSRDTSTVELVPIEDLKGLKRTLSLAEIEDNYEPTGRRMSVLRAPI